MAKTQRNPNSLANLKPPFSKENQPPKERVGRKKSKIKGFIQEEELSYNDIATLAKSVLVLSEKDILGKAVDKETPMIIRLFCRYLLDDMKKGVANNINMLMERAVGKVSDKLDMSGNLDIGSKFEIVEPPEENPDTEETTIEE